MYKLPINKNFELICFVAANNEWMSVDVTKLYKQYNHTQTRGKIQQVYAQTLASWIGDFCPLYIFSTWENSYKR